MSALLGAPMVLDLSACSAGGAGRASGGPGGSTANGGRGGSTASDGAATASGGGGAPSWPNAASGGTTVDAGELGGSGRRRGSVLDGGDTVRKLEAGAVLVGLYAGDGIAATRAAAKRLDFSWLGRGESVLIKIAGNSGFSHPMTTSVNGVCAMVTELLSRGAGRVIVADQSGVEHVRLSAQGRNGATRDMFDQSGMAAVVNAGAETHFFDEQPFDDGYFAATLPQNHSWPRGLHLASVILAVDHIVYMPRVGTHMLAGATLGQKSAIGWLRDDSRHDLHNDAQRFYEKYTEVNYSEEIRSRFRMAITVSEKVLLHGGPDDGTPYAMAPVLVHASTSLPNHDAFGASLLSTLNRAVTQVAAGSQTWVPELSPTENAVFASGLGVLQGAAGPWQSGSPQTVYVAHRWDQGVSQDRALARGWELTGGKPSTIRLVTEGAALDATLQQSISAHGEGLYHWS